MSRNLHHEAGGDPADQGPRREMANQPSSPRDANEFPDVPEGNRPDGDAASTGGGAGDLDQQQLDDYAERLGLIDDGSGAAGATDAGKESATEPGSEGSGSEDTSDDAGTDRQGEERPPASDRPAVRVPLAVVRRVRVVVVGGLATGTGAAGNGLSRLSRRMERWSRRP